MKFKPIYLYGIIIIAAIVILLVVSQENSTEQNQVTFDQNQQIPNDDVHKQLMNQSNSPSKENVSAEYKERITKLKDAVERNLIDTVALKEYADFLSASHKMNEAIPYYEQILDIDSQRTDIHFTLAVVYYNKQDLVKCEEHNKNVLAYDPQNQMAIYNLGAIAATKGQVEKAKGLWNQVININSDSETGKLAKESLSKLN